MASTREIISILVTADAKQAVRELDRVGTTAKTQLGAAEKASGKFTDRVKAGFANNAQAIGTAATALSAFGAVAYQTTQRASELEQAVGASETVFGEAEDTIAHFADTSADKFGLSERAARQLTAQFGALLTNVGFTADEAADTSVKIAQLGADLSAAFGGRPEDAVTALAAAMRGERDPIERYGVALKEADVSARILKLRLDTSTLAAKKNATAVATLSLIYEQTSKASGQFGRESETMAGTQARLTAAFEDLQATIGKEFLPAMQEATANVKLLVDALELVPGPAKTAARALLDPLGPLKILKGQAEKTATSFDEINTALLGVADAGVARAIEALGLDTGELGDAADDAAGGMADFGKSFYTAMGKIDGAKEALDAWKKGVDEALGLPKSLEEATIGWYESVDELTASLKENGRTFDITTEKGRANRESVLGQVEAAEDHAEAIFEQVLATDGLSAAIAAQKYVLTGHRNQLIEQMIALGKTREEAEEYVTSLGLIPELISTTVKLDATMSQSFRDAMGMIGALIAAGLTPSQAGAIASTEFAPGGSRANPLEGLAPGMPDLTGLAVPSQSVGKSAGGGGTVVHLTVNALSADGPEIERVVTSALVNARRRGIAV